jgi:hypothetical protein
MQGAWLGLALVAAGLNLDWGLAYPQTTLHPRLSTAIRFNAEIQLGTADMMFVSGRYNVTVKSADIRVGTDAVQRRRAGSVAVIPPQPDLIQFRQYTVDIPVNVLLDGKGYTIAGSDDKTYLIDDPGITVPFVVLSQPAYNDIFTRPKDSTDPSTISVFFSEAISPGTMSVHFDCDFDCKRPTAAADSGSHHRRLAAEGDYRSVDVSDYLAVDGHMLQISISPAKRKEFMAGAYFLVIEAGAVVSLTGAACLRWAPEFLASLAVFHSRMGDGWSLACVVRAVLLNSK